MAKEVELNIVLLPEDKIRDVAIDISRKVHDTVETDFILDGKTKFPHITVYQARFPEKNMASISATLKTIAGKITPFEVSLGKFSSFGEFIFWDADVTNELMYLHRSVLYLVNPLREGLILKGLQDGKWDMGLTYNIQNYGSLLVGSSYQPHITIAHPTHKEDVKKTVVDLRPRVAKFTANKMCIGLLGDYGTVTKILEEYPFGGQGSYVVKTQNYF